MGKQPRIHSALLHHFGLGERPADFVGEEDDGAPRKTGDEQSSWSGAATRVVMGLFGFLLAAMILRQQLEMGIHRQLWADQSSGFLDLGGWRTGWKLPWRSPSGAVPSPS